MGMPQGSKPKPVVITHVWPDVLACPRLHQRIISDSQARSLRGAEDPVVVRGEAKTHGIRPAGGVGTRIDYPAQGPGASRVYLITEAQDVADDVSSAEIWIGAPNQLLKVMRCFSI